MNHVKILVNLDRWKNKNNTPQIVTPFQEEMSNTGSFWRRLLVRRNV